jgi:hypothetical protein
MAKESVSGIASATVTAQQMMDKASTMHTFESFGRAIVAAALTQVAESSGVGEQSPTTATVSVQSIPGRGTTEASAGAGAAGSAATGTVGRSHTVVVTICFGDSCHTIGV